MVVFPNAKVNLGLNILSKRPDGYHDISTCFYPIGWEDIMEIVPSRQTGIHLTGIPVPGDPDDNLCIRAWKLLKKDFDIPGVSIHLHKLIPSGGGLGGGSSDAAFAIKVLDQIFELYLGTDYLASYASRLGSDCPFFLYNKPLLASGRGELFEEVKVDLSGKYMMVVYPGISVSTPEAYRAVVPSVPEISIKEILENYPIEKWKDHLKNDFEQEVGGKFPEIMAIRENFYNTGAIYSSLSGSGSGVFGIYNVRPSFKLKFPSHYQIWEGKL